MSAGSGTQQVDWWRILVAAGSAIFGIFSGVLINWLSSELANPNSSLEYYSERAIPFEVGGEQIAIYHSTVKNTGDAPIENIFLSQSVPGAKIETGRVTAPPGVSHSDALNPIEFSATVSNLNPDETASVSAFVKSTSNLPERPSLRVRAQGATAREAVVGTQDVGIGRLLAVIFFPPVFAVALFILIARRMKSGSSIQPSVSQTPDPAGIDLVTLDFNKGIDWPGLLQKTKRLDVFVAFGRTWREGNLPHLQQLAERKTIVRLVVPDFASKEVVDELARRFGMRPEDVAKDIQETISRFQQIFQGKKSQLKVWVHLRVPTYTYYRIDSACVVTSYRHRFGKGEVPTLQLRPGGSLANFYDAEFADFVADNSRSVRAL